MSEAPRIHLLDPAVANQIAAGEVVERPASVVKELVENSVDAGARRITVRLVDGGRALVAVSDDGCGMSASDARLAFARHATSKIASAEDLVDIGTYGFRGEALASILAVARVTLTTRRQQDPVGTRLRGAGGVDLDESPVGCSVGTSIEIADLFWNVPARLKFLRTAATELGQVVKYLDALALARPDLHVTLYSGDRKLLDYPPDPDLPRRAAAVLGREVAERLYPVEESQEYVVRGLLSDPGLTHGGPGQLTLLVGGRPVSDRVLAQAIAQAYGTLLERGRYPMGVLRIDCPPGTVDVNVHPAKTEVRFASSSAVFGAVLRALRPMLAATPWIAQQLQADAGRPPNPGEPQRAPSAGRSDSWSPGLPATLRPQPVWSGGVADSGRARAVALELPGAPAAAELGLGSGPWSSLRYVGQVGRCYLVCESAEALLLIDQHAAHERVLYEELSQTIHAGNYPSQRLLSPIAVPLPPAEVAALQAETELLDRLGFEIEPGGERLVRVRAYPSLLKPAAVAGEVREIAASLVQGGQAQPTTERLQRFVATLACHAAFRAGDPMFEADVLRLLQQMDRIDLAAYCPHGRPVWMRAKFDEVGRWFHRT
ncbi:MAG: DNA mismatch repair endonuclease MutL [Deltaproteobacteria bacterium]|nr:DNA mismatch repair endonuclease MutL [Deltaproteobacteria bacterium]